MRRLEFVLPLSLCRMQPDEIRGARSSWAWSDCELMRRGVLNQGGSCIGPNMRVYPIRQDAMRQSMRNSPQIHTICRIVSELRLVLSSNEVMSTDFLTSISITISMYGSLPTIHRPLCWPSAVHMSTHSSSSASPSKRRKLATPLLEKFGEEMKISFSTEYKGNDCYKLVAVDEELLKAVSDGESICLKGSAGKNDAILCSAKKTYHMKKVETSNTVLLADPNDAIVCRSTYSYELKRIDPKFDYLKEILLRSEYRGYEEELESPIDKAVLYTRKDLDETILSSPEELSTMLKEMGAIEIDGYIRLCSFKAVISVHRAIIDTIIEKDWNINEIDRSKCLLEIPDIDIVLLDHALSRLGIKNENGTWALRSNEVARVVAHTIFLDSSSVSIAASSSQLSERLPCDDFMALWASRTPGLDVPSEEALGGIALRIDGYYNYFPVEKMSGEIDTRFQQLFDFKKKYTLEEIQPYIRDFVGKPGQSSEMELMLKYCRKVDDYYVQK